MKDKEEKIMGTVVKVVVAAVAIIAGIVVYKKRNK